MPIRASNSALNLNTTTSVEDLALRSGIRSEHVLLESDELLVSSQEPTRRLRQRFKLRNPIRRSETQLALFDDASLGIRETHRQQKQRERSVDLRCLDPRPLRAKRIAKQTLRVVVALALISGIVGVLAYYGIATAVAYSSVAALATATAVALVVFLKQTDERIAFRTMHGQVIVLTLVANFGCYRKMRALARKLSVHIKDARHSTGDDKQRLLREEMREHYRLAETCFLSDSERTIAVQKILTHFD